MIKISQTGQLHPLRHIYERALMGNSLFSFCLTGIHHQLHHTSRSDQQRNTSVCKSITNERDLSEARTANMLGLVDIDLSGKNHLEKKIPKSEEVKPAVENTSVPTHKPMKTGREQNFEWN